MQSTSYIPNDSYHLHPPWKNCKFPFKSNPYYKPQTLTVCHSVIPSSSSYEEIKNQESFRLPIKIKQSGGKVSQYFWDGIHLSLVPVNGGDSSNLVNFDDGFHKLCMGCKDAVRNFLLPNKVQENYVEYVKWKFFHRVFSSALQVLATQAMFRAMGVGFSRSLPSAAALNWVLKDGLGKLSRCIYSACLASAFDSKLKRVRFSTSVVFSLSIGLELLTPFFPHYFLLLATVANIAKQISLACYLSTRTAVHRSFAVAGNICEISAKAQIQTVCFDTLGLILAAVLNILCKKNHRLQVCLPLVLYPIFSAFDLLGIYQGLKHVHLPTLTKDRLEIITDTWIQSGYVPSPSQVSKEEGISFPFFKGRKRWPIRIGCVNPNSTNSEISLLTMRSVNSNKYYFICLETTDIHGILLSLHEEASATDVIMGLLQACYIRSKLCEENEKWERILDEADNVPGFKEWFDLLLESNGVADREGNLVREIIASGWAYPNILLDVEEQVRYSFLEDDKSD